MVSEVCGFFWHCLHLLYMSRKCIFLKTGLKIDLNATKTCTSHHLFFMPMSFFLFNLVLINMGKTDNLIRFQPVYLKIFFCFSFSLCKKNRTAGSKIFVTRGEESFICFAFLSRTFSMRLLAFNWQRHVCFISIVVFLVSNRNWLYIMPYDLLQNCVLAHTKRANRQKK